MRLWITYLLFTLACICLVFITVQLYLKLVFEHSSMCFRREFQELSFDNEKDFNPGGKRKDILDTEKLILSETLRHTKRKSLEQY